MLLLRRPSDEEIRRFVEFQRELSYSYPEVGATRAETPAGWAVDHNRVQLGEGPQTFARAVEAVRRWEMFHLGWVELRWPDAPIAVGSAVGVLSYQYGFWTLNACRIVYLVEEDGPFGAMASPTAHCRSTSRAARSASPSSGVRTTQYGMMFLPSPVRITPW